MGATVTPEITMTEPLADAKIEEQVEQEAKEMEKELGADEGAIDADGVEEVPSPDDIIEEGVNLDGQE
jgi:hypothetical protein